MTAPLTFSPWSSSLTLQPTSQANVSAVVVIFRRWILSSIGDSSLLVRGCTQLSLVFFSFFGLKRNDGDACVSSELSKKERRGKKKREKKRTAVER